MIYLRETPQNGVRKPTIFKCIEAVHNCPAVWDVSSLAHKDTNNLYKTKRRSALTNWVSSKPFYFSTAFCFFFSSVSLLYVSATTLKKRPCCKLPCLLFDTSLTCEGKSLSTFRSFPTRVCHLKFAVWRPLKTVRPPRRVAECLTKLSENVSLQHFPFLYRDFSFIAFIVSTDPWWQPD